MVNHTRYGGGGIYNLFCTFTSDNQWYEYLFLHEFGHAFAGLADEYYTSDVPTTSSTHGRRAARGEHHRPARPGPAVKWKDRVTPATAVPTPWEKAAFDAMDLGLPEDPPGGQRPDRQDEAGRRPGRRRRASSRPSPSACPRTTPTKVDAFLAASQFAGKVGVFEGAGYAAEGLYRPMLDCLMFTKGDKPLCQVCEAAVRRTILFYAGLMGGFHA